MSGTFASVYGFKEGIDVSIILPELQTRQDVIDQIEKHWPEYESRLFAQKSQGDRRRVTFYLSESDWERGAWVARAELDQPGGQWLYSFPEIAEDNSPGE